MERLRATASSLVLALWLVGCGGGDNQPGDGGTDARRDVGLDSVGVGTGGRGTAGTGGSGLGGFSGAGGSGGVVGSGGSAGGNGSGGQPGIGGTGDRPGSTGGASASGGVVGTGGRATGGGGGGSGGAGTGGMRTGGAGTGGAGTGGAGTGGAGTGGAGTGGAGTGGANTGGAGTGTGGAGTGGANTGGANTGGANTGGANTGGANTGGANTGGANTGGANTGGANTGGAGTGGAGTGGAGGTPNPNASMYVVAHPDDDLLFINPQVDTDIVAGRRVRTVYTTSGDAGCTPTNTFCPNPIWMGREINVMKAYALMANVVIVNPWTCAAVSYAGKSTTRCSLMGTMVDLVFIRLPDGRVRELNTSPGTPLPTFDNPLTTYTRAEFMATLAAIQADVNPSRVGTLDGSLAHGYEHDDHISTAQLAFDVARDGAARQLIMYRGYTMDEDTRAPPPIPEPENLTTPQYTRKAGIFMIYNFNAPPTADVYDRWCHRQYPINSVVGVAGLIHQGSTLCLEAASAADGAVVTLAACAAGPTQTWTVSATGQIVGVGGRCLGLDVAGTSAVVEPCTGAADQRWTLMSDGQIKGSLDTCLASPGASVLSATCGAELNSAMTHYFPPASQSWGL